MIGDGVPALTTLFLLSLATLVTCDWIDPDTPASARTTRPLPLGGNATVFYPASEEDSTSTLHEFKSKQSNTQQYELVMSDEFNVPHRNFSDGSDPMWTALNKNDYTNAALHYYSHDEITTNTQGKLAITTRSQNIDIIGFDETTREKSRVTKHFSTGMLQSWNKFCFTGGVLEAAVTLPGKSDVGGLWPSLWLLGNLSRHTYVASSDHLWPFSNPHTCDFGSKKSLAQRISSCLTSVHYGLQPNTGRGAPEVDIFEIQPGKIKKNTGPFKKMSVGQPFMSSSYQLAPGLTNRPTQGGWPKHGDWYRNMIYGTNTSFNVLFYGGFNHFNNVPDYENYWSDAISFNRQLNENYFEGDAKENDDITDEDVSHVYRLEWEVPDETTGDRGHLRWFLDGELVLNIDGKSIDKVESGAEISSEPSSIIMNTAVSSTWGFTADCTGSCPCKKYDCASSDYKETCGFNPGFCDMIQDPTPPTFQVDWIRVYQDPSNKKHKVGCSTPERPTKTYIDGNAHMYTHGNDAVPLKEIQNGLGVCDPSVSPSIVGPQTCGGSSRGKCSVNKVCACSKGWMGPHCLVRDGYNDHVWHVEPTFTFYGPSKLSIAMSVTLVLTGCSMVVLNKFFGTYANKAERVPLVSR